MGVDVSEETSDSEDGEWMKESEEDWSGSDTREEESVEGQEESAEKEPCITAIEQTKGAYENPLFQISEWEERRLRKPWRQAVIVKFLGRQIGFKALENRLRQMWVRDGILTMVDVLKWT